MTKIYEIMDERINFTATITGFYQNTNLESIAMVFEQIFQRQFLVLATESDLKTKIKDLSFQEYNLQNAISCILKNELSHLEWTEAGKIIIIYDPKHVRKNTILRRRTDMLFIYESFRYQDTILNLSLCSALLFVCEYYARSIVFPIEYCSLESVVEISSYPKELFGNFLEKLLRSLSSMNFEYFENTLRFRFKKIPLNQIN